MPAELNCWGSIVQAWGAKSWCDSCPRVILFGRMKYEASSICRAAVLHRGRLLLAQWLGLDPGMLSAAIPAQKRASGCQRARKIGQVRVLLLLKAAHKRIADLVLAWPRSLCSSPTGCAMRKSWEKVILPACPRELVERLETAQHFAETWSTRSFLCY